MTPSYEDTLVAAGATLIDSKHVGSYQGSWGAIVEYNDQKCLVVGAYGSCSGCDSLQSEFDYYNSAPEESNGKYYLNGNTWDEDSEITKEQYEEELQKYQQRLSDFGQSYLTTPFFKEDIERKLASFKEDEWFDGEEKELYEWAITFFN